MFLIVIDTLLLNFKANNAGLSIYGSFVGAAAHADDIRTVAASKKSITDQADIIDDFTSGNHLKLNSSKTEIIKISWNRPTPDQVNLSNSSVNTRTEGKCLGV